jgi:N-carbamoyl-L-amino-acid hydrolase
MVGLELARWITECELDLPVVAVSFACEESTRFGFGTVGSGWLAGEVALEGPDMPLDRQGAPLAEVVAQSGIGDAGPAVERRVEDFLGLLEVHIDQGTILTSLGAHVGAVDTIWGVDRLELTWSGQTAHSGGRWREDRRDALLAACGFVVAADAWWSAVDPAGRHLQLTVGSLRVEPNSPNTVAGIATAIVDARAPSLETIVRSAQEVIGLAEAQATSQDVVLSTRHLGRSRPLQVDHALAGILKDSASRAGHQLPNVPSLAGHDALVIGRHAPTAMILIANPTGISHAPQEELDPEGLEQAFSVMVEALPATIENLSRR